MVISKTGQVGNNTAPGDIEGIDAVVVFNRIHHLSVGIGDVADGFGDEGRRGCGGVVVEEV